mmetsp:Transcript_29163/g.52858  ORF Transcript_29163/g.52858 Transcript_29163/m.52858 type:complete len:207 (-) Transcript_29163:2464-3084(-)
MLIPSDASSSRRSCSAALPAAGGTSSFGLADAEGMPTAGGNFCFLLPAFSGNCGSLARNGPSASGSAPKSKASCSSSDAPGGASAATEAKANGISANGARDGSLTQICKEHLQRRNRMSAGNRSCTNEKSSGQEKFLSHRVCPSDVCGRRTPRRQSPLSHTDSKASDSIGAPCLPGSFGSSAKNCVIRDAIAIASVTSLPSSISPS